MIKNKVHYSLREERKIFSTIFLIQKMHLKEMKSVKFETVQEIIEYPRKFLIYQFDELINQVDIEAELRISLHSLNQSELEALNANRDEIINRLKNHQNKCLKDLTKEKILNIQNGFNKDSQKKSIYLTLCLNKWFVFFSCKNLNQKANFGQLVLFQDFYAPSLFEANR